MSVYTPLTREEVAALFERYHFGSLVNFSGIEEGMENTNYVLSDNLGNQFILTILESSDETLLQKFMVLMQRYDNMGLPVSKPIQDKSGHFFQAVKSKPTLLCHKLPGNHIDQTNKLHCRELGRHIALLHIATVDLSIDGLEDKSLSWLLKQIPNLQSESVQLELHLTEKDLDLLSELSEQCHQFLITCQALPRHIIHGDLFRDNVLFDINRGQLVLTGIIDFYQAGPGLLIYDLAVAINDWCLDQHRNLDFAKIRTLLQAYHSVRPISEPEAKALPAVLKFAAFRFWISRLLNIINNKEHHQSKELHSNIPITIKDPKEFKSLLLTHQVHEREMITLCQNLLLL